MSEHRTETEIVRASELGARVVQRIFELRNPESMPDYRATLKQYNKRRRGREEVTYDAAVATSLDGEHNYGIFERRQRRGYALAVHGQTVYVPRPERPVPRAWGYRSYDRSSGFTTHATEYGLLADPRFNREIRPQRVDEYAAEMESRPMARPD